LNTFYQRQIGYERQSELTGTDIVLKNNDDLVTNGGDFTTITGVALITAALMRRLQTPTNGYKRLVRSSTGLQVTDDDYGNAVYDNLSNPITAATTLEIEQKLRKAATAESRIEVINVKVNQTDLTTLVADITYRILSESELRTLQLKV
jgi:phage baseplate assembly protein W